MGHRERRILGLLAVLAATAATGCESEPDSSPITSKPAAVDRTATPTTVAAPAAVDEPLTLSCGDFFPPNRRFLNGPGWRRPSVSLGPLTLVGVRRLSSARAGSPVLVKIPILLEADQAVVLRVRPQGGTEGGLVPVRADLENPTPADGRQRIALDACPRTSGGPANAVGTQLVMAKPGCVRFSVAVKGRRDRAVSLPVATKRC